LKSAFPDRQSIPTVNTKRHSFRQSLRNFSSVAVSHLIPGITARALAKRFLTPDPRGKRFAMDALASTADVLRDEIAIDGDNLAVYQWGNPSSQPYVLLGHGWSSYALRFAAWIPRLRALGYAVVTFDQRAHGMSEGRISSLPDFVLSLRAIGRRFGRPAAFIGHSMGASSIVFAEEPSWCPERFVLIAPMFSAEESVRRGFIAMNFSPRVFQPFEDWFHDTTGERFANFHAERCVPHIDRPALVIHDRLDRVTPWEHGRLYAYMWPHARMLSTNGLGHDRMLDHPSVIEAALEFVAEAVAA
jgi:pimeloyl-ACP methyl ester carboxylesterase